LHPKQEPMALPSATPAGIALQKPLPIKSLQEFKAPFADRSIK
jgi:hypothetical protein